MKYVFLDIETTGLDPYYNDLILEIGFAVLNEQREEIGRRGWVLGVESSWLSQKFKEMPAVVFNMHTENGLFQECIAPDAPRDMVKVQEEIILWLMEHGVEEGVEPLHGNTISFDKSFIALHLPMIDGFFDYHVVDVSSFKILFNRIQYTTKDNWEQGKVRSNHRVDRCLTESIREFNFLVDILEEQML